MTQYLTSKAEQFQVKVFLLFPLDSKQNYLNNPLEIKNISRFKIVLVPIKVKRESIWEQKKFWDLNDLEPRKLSIKNLKGLKSLLRWTISFKLKFGAKKSRVQEICSKILCKKCDGSKNVIPIMIVVENFDSNYIWI